MNKNKTNTKEAVVVNIKPLVVKTLPANAKKGFSLLAGINRAISPAHVTKIEKAIRTLAHIVRPVVVADISFISGKVERYIIDGQHLYNAMLRLGLQIQYEVIVINTQEELVAKLAALNHSSKSWCMADYITIWASIRNQYKLLNSYLSRYDIELSVLVSILMGLPVPKSTGGGASLQHVKKGTFIINDLKRADLTLSYLTDILTLVPRTNRKATKWVCGTFVNVFNQKYSDYNHKHFMAKMEIERDKGTFLLATEDYATLEQKMFNMI